jgi:sphingomyelin phosphodiesterase 2
MKTMFCHANLVDTWAATHPPPPTSPPGRYDYSRQHDAQAVLGLTVDTPQNSWSAGKRLDNFARRWSGKRLDYILYNSSTLPYSRNAGSTLSVRNTAIVLTERVPGYDFSYSDHFGLEATFAVVPPNKSSPPDPQPIDSAQNMLPSEDLLTAIGALSHWMNTSNRRTRRHIAYLIISFLFLFLAILGPSRIDPASTRWKWNASLAAVVAAISTIGGATGVCAGIIYGIRERSRLTNLIEEMECARRAMTAPP